MYLSNFFLFFFLGLIFTQAYDEATEAIQEAKKHHKFASVVYCLDSQIKRWDCKACREAPNVKFIKSFNNNTTGTRGVLLKNDVEKTIIISFRGAQNNENFQQIIRGNLINHNKGTEGKVHEGFHESMLSLYPEIIKTTTELFNVNKNYTVIVTGHSLGGALASLAIVKIKKTFGIPDNKLKLITYGQPMTGDAVFASWMNKQTFTKYRVINKYDEVPHYFFQRLIYPEYRHFDREIWIQKDGNAKLCRKIEFEDPDCSVSNLDAKVLNWDDHSDYFGSKFGGNACNPSA